MNGVAGPFIHGRALEASYRRMRVLHGVDVAVHAGQVHGLIGPNGAGKSTLLRLLGGIGRPSGGEVRTADGDLGSLSPRERARLVTYLPQETRIDADLTVRSVVELGRYAHRRPLDRMRGTSSPADAAAVASALERVGVSELAERPITELSGGQRQLVLIAKQLAQQARVLLLDEPVSALDLRYQLRVIALLRELASDGHAVVAVLHDLNLAARACDQLTLLADGRTVAAGPPREVLTTRMLAASYAVRCAVDDDPRLGVPRVTVLAEHELPGRPGAPPAASGQAERILETVPKHPAAAGPDHTP